MVRHGIRAVLALAAASVVAISACGGNVATGSGGATTTGSSSSSGVTSTNGTTSTGASGTSTSSGASSSGASTGSGGNCNPASCQPGFICCGGGCVNAKNDIANCGSCGNKCTGANPYCDKGTCGTPPCTGSACTAAQICCGDQCCATGQLCCDVYGPVQPVLPQCTTPVNGTCPAGCTACQCASPDTPIATPTGDRPIAELAAGDLVYSVDHGAIVAVPILRASRTPQRDHHVVQVRLATGAVLEVSPRHPTADGRTFGDLRAGEALDRLAITSVELIPYQHPFTHDILPASETHTYFAAGALIGTTLTP